MAIKNKINLKKNRIRAFFLTLEGKPKSKEEQSNLYKEIEEKGMAYYQMRLPVEKITKEFEESLRKKVERNILHAKIREATEEDLESLMNIYNKAWLTSNTPFRPIDIESLRFILNDPDTIILIARVYGIDAGFVILDFEGDNKEIGIIAGLGVIPRFQRRGLGTVLGMAAWDYFKKRNVKELRCEVYVNNKVSYNFITSIGFENTGIKTYKKEDFKTESN
ncbi:MAG: GNAT family N-acetyltransferase [Promethearchaeota archaeon]